MVTGPVSPSLWQLLHTVVAIHDIDLNSLSLQPLPSHARSWHGKEEWFSLSEFTSMLQSEDYRPLINCESWQVSGNQS